MLVQLVCRSDKDKVIQDELNVPFHFTNHHELNFYILVPTQEYYHQVKGQLLIEGLTAKVIYIHSDTTYRPSVGVVPYALVTLDFTPVCDVVGVGLELEYYFTPKLS